MKLKYKDIELIRKSDKVIEMSIKNCGENLYFRRINGFWEEVLDENFKIFRIITNNEISKKLDDLYYEYLEKNRPEDLIKLFKMQIKIRNKMIENKSISEKEKETYKKIKTFLERNNISEYTLFNDVTRLIYESKKLVFKKNYQKSFKLNDNLISIGDDIYFKEKDGNLTKIKNKDIINTYKDKISLFNNLINHVNYEF